MLPSQIARLEPDRRADSLGMVHAPTELGAVVAVVVPRGRASSLPRMLDALRDAGGPAALRLARGALAILVLSPEPDAVAPILDARAAGFPHHLRLHATADTSDDHSCIRLAARIARLLGAPNVPVFLLDARLPPAPGWLYAASAALRDGETIVRARRSLLSVLRLGPAAPRGVSVAGRDLFRPGRPVLSPRARLRPAVV